MSIGQQGNGIPLSQIVQVGGSTSGAGNTPGERGAATDAATAARRSANDAALSAEQAKSSAASAQQSQILAGSAQSATEAAATRGETAAQAAEMYANETAVDAQNAADSAAQAAQVLVDAVKYPELAAPTGAALSGFRQGGTGAVARTVAAELRQMIRPEQFGAVGNANYFNTADNKWYANNTYTTEATNDSAAIQAALNEAAKVTGDTGAAACVLLTRKYRVVESLDVPSLVSIIGTGPVQNATVRGSALCADHSLTSVRQADNSWTNPVLRLNNRSLLIGSNHFENFSIFGGGAGLSQSNFLNQTGWADRVAIQRHFSINMHITNMWIGEFKKPAISHVASQDSHYTGLTVNFCGTNTASEIYYALEYLRDPTDATISGTNAIHHEGLRVENCWACIRCDNGTSNRGEINFTITKFESGTYQTYDNTLSPIHIQSGFGPVVFGDGTQFRFPTCKTAGGTNRWVLTAGNYATQLEGCTGVGRSQFFRGTSVDGIDMADVKVLEADPDLVTVSCLDRGRLRDITILHQFVAGQNTRRGISVGADSSVHGAQFAQLNDPTVAITVGSLIQCPASETVDTNVQAVNIHVDRNKSATTANYALLAAGTAGVNGTLRTNVVKLTNPRRSGDYDVLTLANQMVVIGLEDIEFTAPTTGTRALTQFRYGHAGQVIRVHCTAAAAPSITISNTSTIVTKTGAALTFTNEATVYEFLCLDGVKWVQL